MKLMPPGSVFNPPWARVLTESARLRLRPMSRRARSAPLPLAGTECRPQPDVAGNARHVAEQMPYRRRLPGRFAVERDAPELGQIFLDRIVERELPMIGQDHEQRRGQRLRAGRHLHPRIDLQIAKGLPEDDLAPMHENERHARHGLLLDRAAEDSARHRVEPGLRQPVSRITRANLLPRIETCVCWFIATPGG